MDSAQSHPLAGTEGVNIAPWWSPDSRFLAYLDKQRHIVQMDATGGPPEEVCDLRSVGTAWHGGSWNKESGMILGLDGMFRCSTTNGVLTRLTTVEQSRNELFHGRPVPLPDGRHFLYMRYSRDAEMTGIYVGSLDSKPDVQDRHLLFPTQFGTAYAPSQDPLLGHVLFLRGTALMAQPFDVRRLRLTGEAERVAEAVGNNGNVFGFFSAADNGTLSYRRTASADSQLTWFDRQGKQLSEVGEPAPYQYVRLSPDGTRAARGLLGGFLLNPDIWLLEFARGVSTRFTFGNNTKADPVWSPDGAHIAFYRGRDLYQKASNGAGDEELLVKSAESKRPTSWSSDGRFLLYDVLDPHTKYDLWMLPLQGGREPFPILHSEFNEGSGRLSPGMQWLAYQSDESGTNEIYIRPLNFSVTNTVSLGEGKTLISKGGGIRPVWRGDGRELYYQAPDRKVMAVEIGSGPALQAGIPQPLFQVPDAETAWDVSMDGKRFLLPVPVTQSAQTPITVVLNWQAGLKK
jgi:Tol biopolymer transport system component